MRVGAESTKKDGRKRGEEYIFCCTTTDCKKMQYKIIHALIRDGKKKRNTCNSESHFIPKYVKLNSFIVLLLAIQPE